MKLFILLLCTSCCFIFGFNTGNNYRLNTISNVDTLPPWITLDTSGVDFTIGKIDSFLSFKFVIVDSLGICAQQDMWGCWEIKDCERSLNALTATWQINKDIIDSLYREIQMLSRQETVVQYASLKH